LTVLAEILGMQISKLISKTWCNYFRKKYTSTSNKLILKNTLLNV